MALQFGNHEEATMNQALLCDLINKNVACSHALLLPLKHIIKIPGVILAPMTIHKQNTINKHGHIIAKD